MNDTPARPQPESQTASARSLRARISAGIIFIGVALGAFGAHGLREVLAATPRGEEVWRTAVLYHLLHGVTLYFLAVTGGSVMAWRFLAAGILCFSGSLYLLSTLHWKWLGPVTPLGGLFFLTGWALLALAPGRRA